MQNKKYEVKYNPKGKISQEKRLICMHISLKYENKI